MEDYFDMYDPGPVDKSVLHLQNQHRSTDVWADKEESNLKVLARQSFNLRLWVPSKRVIPYLQRAGFYHCHRVGEGFILDHNLIIALVERWRPETHTFHFAVGEMTVTLQDVAVIMGLRVDGSAVTGTADRIWSDVCQRLLGVCPDGNFLRGSSLKLKWLHEHFSHLPADASDETVQQYARAYILYIIGCVLLPDKSSTSVQLIYLPLLENFDYCGRLSWGAATLACLYKGLCRASAQNAHKISGPLLLLQIWSQERLYVGWKFDHKWRLKDPLKDPLACYWRNGSYLLTHEKFLRSHDLEFYRDLLDIQTNEHVKWQPYTDTILASLPAICTEGRDIWRAEVPLICFDMIEWHFPSRVMRQWGLLQEIPRKVYPEAGLHKGDRRGGRWKNWETIHHKYIELWVRWRESVVQGIPGPSQLPHFGPYMTWYRRITRRYMKHVEVFQPTGSVRHAMEYGISQVLDKLCNVHDATSVFRAKLCSELAIDSLHQLHRLLQIVRLPGDDVPMLSNEIGVLVGDSVGPNDYTPMDVVGGDDQDGDARVDDADPVDIGGGGDGGEVADANAEAIEESWT